MQSDSEEEPLPHVPTSSGTGSSQRTLQYTDREENESEDSQKTRQHDDQEADLGPSNHPTDVDSLIRNTQTRTMLTGFART